MAAYNSHHTHESTHARHTQPARHAKAVQQNKQSSGVLPNSAAKAAAEEENDEESIKPDDFNRKLRLRVQPATKQSNATSSQETSVPAQPKKRGRPRKIRPEAPAPPSAAAAPTPPRGRLARTNSTPARQSLRQAMAASVRESSATPSLTNDTEDPLARHRSAANHDLEVSDLDLDGTASSSSGYDFDSEMEEEEETEIRRDFEATGDTTEDDQDILSYASDADDDIDDAIVEQVRARRTRENTAVAEEDNSDLDSLAFNFDSDLLPPTGGLGVVTWSDYDSLDATDSADEAGSAPGEHGDDDDEATFEESLEELLAISEAVVGQHPRNSHARASYEDDADEMWFEDVSSDDEDDDDAEGRSGDRTILLVDDWDARRGVYVSDDERSDSFDVEWEFNESDRGNTTDSLDSDDHAGLKRFGIEADSDEGSDVEMGSDGPVHNGTTSLADVQAPTTADLAFLPQFQIINAAKETPRRIKLTSSSMTASMTSSAKKTKRRESAAHKKVPAMGTFENKTRSRAVVISDNGNVAPSPFVRRHRGREFTLSSSRRSRSDSKVSTTSTGMSMTEGSVLGDHGELSPPIGESGTFRFDINDVLHASFFDMASGKDANAAEGTTSTSDESETDGGHALSSDLSRWNRVPIGAFRSSTMLAFSPSTHAFMTHEPSTPQRSKGRKGGSKSNHKLFVPFTMSSAMRKTAGSVGETATLSSPHAGLKLSRRALERRMLTSPVMGPSASTHTLVPSSAISSASPKSNKTRRKERKMMAMRTSPKRSLVVGNHA